MYIDEGAVDWVQALVHRSREGQQRSTSSCFRFQLILSLSASGWSEIEMEVFTTDILSLLLSLLLPDNSHLFLHSFVPLRALIIETCSWHLINPLLSMSQPWRWLRVLRSLRKCQRFGRKGQSQLPPHLPCQATVGLAFIILIKSSSWTSSYL